MSSVVRRVVDETSKQLRGVLDAYLSKLVRRLVRILVLGIVGISLVAAGALFLLVSFAKFLSGLVVAWLAWDLTGGIVVVIGAALLLVVLRR